MSAEERDRGDTYAFDFDAPAQPRQARATRGAFQLEGDEAEAADARASGARRAHLRVSRVNPWSVTKFGFVVALVCFIVLFVAVAVLYGILSLLGVFDAVNSAVSMIVDGNVEWFTAPKVLGYSAFLGAINVILVTLLAAVGTFIYNLGADLVGGIEVTLTERE